MKAIQHGGNRRKLAEEAGSLPDELLDFSANLHPAGPPPGSFGVYFSSFDELGDYPEPYAESVNEAIAKKLEVPAEFVQTGNGSNQLLALLPEVLGGKRALIVTPGYLEYEAACPMPVEHFPLRREEDFAFDPERFEKALRPGDLAILGNPGNPAGNAVESAALLALIDRNPGVNFLVDEAFADFLPPGYSLGGAIRPNLAVTRSFTKFFALPGLRMGYALAPAPVIARLRAKLPAWSVATPALRMMEFLLNQENDLAGLTELRRELAAGLAKLPGVKVYPSMANYLLLETGRPELRRRLLCEHRIAIRDCSNYPGLGEGFYRVAVRTAKENDRLLTAFAALLAPGTPFLARPRKTPALMLQGTASNAGKSVLTAAFCRILLEDGFRVAPFKAQNMALNSFVTPDGGEIGRAQAVQAEACRLDPDVRMNPILLKPTGDTGSQVVVLGKPIGNMRVREYYANKARLWESVKTAYDSLSKEYEVMVLEGAGSPGEVNLKKNDLVNMRMARHAEAKVLRAGDIDRGGVYSSFIGSYATFEPWERELLAGFLVNKFRGDPTLLGDAHDYVRAMTGKPVLGVIDHQRDLGLPEEDSVNFSFIRPAPKHETTLDVVLIPLGRIANFTDFAPLELEPDVTMRKIRNAGEFGTPDIVILPGSKGVAEDLIALREQGFEAKIREAAARGAMIVGICGGLQMLGMRFLDPDEIESPVREVPGLGFLPLTTVMKREKLLRRTRAKRSDGTPLSGYEIHHGVTEFQEGTMRHMRSETGEIVGGEVENFFVTYLHGVFDDDRFRRTWLDEVRARKGLAPLGGVTARYGTEEALNRLAAHVRSRIDMKNLYRMLGV